MQERCANRRNEDGERRKIMLSSCTASPLSILHLFCTTFGHPCRAKETRVSQDHLTAIFQDTSDKKRGCVWLCIHQLSNRRTAGSRPRLTQPCSLMLPRFAIAKATTTYTSPLTFALQALIILQQIPIHISKLVSDNFYDRYCYYCVITRRSI